MEPQLNRLKEQAEQDARQQARHKRNVKRIVAAGLFALALHLLFINVVAPWLRFNETYSKTEVTQISAEELSQLKQKILKNNRLAPLLKQELRKEFESKEAPKDAQMMAPFNQKVPEQMVAGARREIPKEGGGKQNQTKQKRLKLSKLGLGNKIPRPARQQQDKGQGPPGPHRPVGRTSKDIRQGDRNLLNAVQNEFYSFFSRFEEPIIRNWYFLARQNEAQLMSELMGTARGRSGSTFYTGVKIILDRRGKLVAVDVVESSGLPTADYIVTRAIRRIGSFPNPPPALFKGKKYFAHVMRFGVYGATRPAVDMQWR